MLFPMPEPPALYLPTSDVNCLCPPTPDRFLEMLSYAAGHCTPGLYDTICLQRKCFEAFPDFWAAPANNSVRSRTWQWLLLCHPDFQQSSPDSKMPCPYLFPYRIGCSAEGHVLPACIFADNSMQHRGLAMPP